jgi:peptide/nickel transport system permease protein
MFSLFRRKKTVTKAEPGQSRLIWENLKQNRLSMIALFVLGIIIVLAVFADVIADYDTMVLGQNVKARSQAPSAEHVFGTDSMGRDLAARVLHGSRYTLIYGIGCTALSLVGGSLLGAIAAYYGGKVDALICRIVDALLCIPFILLALTLVAVLGTGLKSMIIAIVLANVPSYTRMIRSVVLTVVRQDYIEAARAAGTKDLKIIFLHVLPNAMGPIIVNATMSIAGLIMSAAGLSFIGMGIKPPAPEWGNMLAEGMKQMRQAPHVVLFPGIAIVITALMFNLLGDGLSDALDPKRRRQ